MLVQDFAKSLVHLKPFLLDDWLDQYEHHTELPWRTTRRGAGS